MAGLAGGFIALTTRSGTNEYHGAGRYFRRHDSLNANNFFNNARNIPRPLYRYNFYGWDFGGPVPWVGKNKLFFFINQEYYDQLVPQLASVNIRVPTEAERNGDFSQSVTGNGQPIVIRDPATGQAFLNSIIPSSRLYGPGQAILKALPVAEHECRPKQLQLHLTGAKFLSEARKCHSHGLANLLCHSTQRTLDL
jgi:hypothetical protein